MEIKLITQNINYDWKNDMEQEFLYTVLPCEW